jgi:hypothetical protein
LSVYNGRVWKGLNLAIKEANQDYTVRLNREQSETLKNTISKSQVMTISSKKLKRKPNQMAVILPFNMRKNWIKLQGRFLPIMKIRSPKTNRVLRLDPSKYSSHLYLTIDTTLNNPLNSDKSLLPITRTTQQLETQRKRAGIWTHSEQTICKKILKNAIMIEKKMQIDSKRSGKSIRLIKEEYERNSLLLKEKGVNMDIVDLIFGNDNNIIDQHDMVDKVVEFDDEVMDDCRNAKMEGVLEFTDDENELQTSNSLFVSDDEEIFFSDLKPKKVWKKVVGEELRSRQEMLDMFSEDDT